MFLFQIFNRRDVTDGVVYSSKIGIAAYAVIGIMISLGIALILISLTDENLKGTSTLIVLSLFIFITLVLLPALLLVITHLRIKVTLKGNSMLVEGYIKKIDIGYSSITRVRETSDFFQYYYAPSVTSLHQIEITYKDKKGRKSIEYVCPKKRQEFLSELEAKLQGPGVFVKKEKGKKRKITFVELVDFGSEEANSVVKFTFRLYVLAMAFGTCIAIFLILGDRELAGLGFAYVTILLSLPVLLPMSRQARKVKEKMDDHDILAARARSKKSKMIAAVVFLISVSAMFFIAVLLSG